MMPRRFTGPPNTWMPLSGKARRLRSDTAQVPSCITSGDKAPPLLHHSDAAAIRADPGWPVGHAPLVFLKTPGADLKAALTVPAEGLFLPAAVTGKFLFPALPGSFLFSIHIRRKALSVSGY